MGGFNQERYRTMESDIGWGLFQLKGNCWAVAEVYTLLHAIVVIIIVLMIIFVIINYSDP